MCRDQERKIRISDMMHQFSTAVLVLSHMLAKQDGQGLYEQVVLPEIYELTEASGQDGLTVKQ